MKGMMDLVLIDILNGSFLVSPEATINHRLFPSNHITLSESFASIFLNLKESDQLNCLPYSKT